MHFDHKIDQLRSMSCSRGRLLRNRQWIVLKIDPARGRIWTSYDDHVGIDCDIDDRLFSKFYESPMNSNDLYVASNVVDVSSICECCPTIAFWSTRNWCFLNIGMSVNMRRYWTWSSSKSMDRSYWSQIDRGSIKDRSKSMNSLPKHAGPKTKGPAVIAAGVGNKTTVCSTILTSRDPNTL